MSEIEGLEAKRNSAAYQAASFLVTGDIESATKAAWECMAFDEELKRIEI